MLSKAQSDRIHELCSRISVEQDREKFLNLVKELNRLLGASDLAPRKSEPDNLSGN
jgi:hypothetical protein